ncbi:MAG: transposase family protein [Parachlamydiaceae bacterium]|nr:transposase family protein [Parachlamydiaceae bacterium]
MIEGNLWVSKKFKKEMHPIRPRRELFGEIVQIDASIHLWFEDRGDKCALIVFIDDATSKLTSLKFCKSECLEGYFNALEDHLLRYGRPRALYSDRHAIFGGSDKIHNAQFIRALKELGIDSILAGSPQAKGRVERANQTLQDRLVKEMRLRNICNIEDAN